MWSVLGALDQLRGRSYKEIDSSFLPAPEPLKVACTQGDPLEKEPHSGPAARALRVEHLSPDETHLQDPPHRVLIQRPGPEVSVPREQTSRNYVASRDISSVITQYPLTGTLGSERRPHLCGGVRHTEENQWLGGPLEDLGHSGLCTVLQTHTHPTHPQQHSLQPWELRPTGSMSDH